MIRDKAHVRLAIALNVGEVDPMFVVFCRYLSEPRMQTILYVLQNEKSLELVLRSVDLDRESHV